MGFDYDICIIGSGAGGGPIAMVLAEAGYSVVVLEKGPWLKESDFAKDEISTFRRFDFRPNLHEEPQVVEFGRPSSGWKATPTPETNWNFWYGSMVGGATNLMSGFFYRMKPDDFHLLDKFGPIPGTNMADWPISYDDLEPYYNEVEKIVGVSGRVVEQPFADKRSSSEFPLSPAREHPLADEIDSACQRLNLYPFPLPRAILTKSRKGRKSCEYSGYCGGYGCTTGAKGSSRVAFLPRAVATGRCDILTSSQVHRIISGSSGRAVSVEYSDKEETRHRLTAKIFVAACSAIESARLLLNSPGVKHPKGLANSSGLVGKNLLFSATGGGSGKFSFDGMDSHKIQGLKRRGPFVNRAMQDWYHYKDHNGTVQKGGTLGFLLSLPSPIGAAIKLSRQKGKCIWGWEYKEKLLDYFKGSQHLEFEIFSDWMPTNNTFVSLDPKIRDKWGFPVSRIRIYRHHRHKLTARHLATKGSEVFKEMGATDIKTWGLGEPAAKLAAGTCRFGHDPETSVLDSNCRAHDVDNLYVTDGSFVPTGGSVPYSFTIYANALRVAEHIVRTLS